MHVLYNRLIPEMLIKHLLPCQAVLTLACGLFSAVLCSALLVGEHVIVEPVPFWAVSVGQHGGSGQSALCGRGSVSSPLLPR